MVETVKKDIIEYHIDDKVTHKDYLKEQAIFKIVKIDEESRRYRYLLVRGTPGTKSSHRLWASADDIGLIPYQMDKSNTAVPASKMASVQQEADSSEVTVNQ